MLQAVVSFQCSGPPDSTGTAAGRQLVAGSDYGRLDRNSSLALETALNQLAGGVIFTLRIARCASDIAVEQHERSVPAASHFIQHATCARCLQTPSITSLCFCAGAGARSYEMRKLAYVYLAGLLASSAVALVAMTAVFPWWRQTRPAIPALPVLQLAVAVMTPIVFIIGFAGCGSVGAALREITSELRTLAAQIL